MGDDPAFTAALGGGGRLQVDSTQLLVVWVRGAFPPADSAGDVVITMRHIVYVFGAHFQPAPDAEAVPLPFYPKVKRVRLFIKALLEAGIPKEPVKDLKAARDLVGRWAPKVPARVRHTTVTALRTVFTLYGVFASQCT